MPILYETYAPRMKKLRPKRISSLQKEEPDYYRVVEEYAVSSIYMTPTDLKNHIRNALKQACEDKGEQLVAFRVLNSWAIWKVTYTEYHIEYEAYIGGSPISPLIVPLILALCITILIVFAIWLVITKVIEPIWGVIPPYAKPWLGTLLLVGAGLSAVALGIYVVKSVIPKVRK